MCPFLIPFFNSSAFSLLVSGTFKSLRSHSSTLSVVFSEPPSWLKCSFRNPSVGWVKLSLLCLYLYPDSLGKHLIQRAVSAVDTWAMEEMACPRHRPAITDYTVLPGHLRRLHRVPLLWQLRSCLSLLSFLPKSHFSGLTMDLARAHCCSPAWQRPRFPSWNEAVLRHQGNCQIKLAPTIKCTWKAKGCWPLLSELSILDDFLAWYLPKAVCSPLKNKLLQVGIWGKLI